MSETGARAGGTAAEQVASALAAAGCRHAFGIPGGEVLTLIEAMRQAGVAFTLAKHENPGGFMAEGTTHVTGAPGVLVATIGPGVANAVNVMVNALQDQVPLIVIAGAADPAEAETYTHQVFDQAAAFRSVVKASVTLTDGAVAVQMGKAIATALEGPQGPVLVDLGVGLAATPQPAAPRYTTPRAAPASPAAGPALDAARAMLQHAKRPVLLAGVGAVLDEAGPALRQVAERFGAPLLTTYKAKGLIDEAHPLCLGGHGLSPLSDSLVLPFLAEADCVLSVGYDPIEMRHGWRDPFAPEVHVELVRQANRHGMHGAAASFIGDVRAGLERLTDDLAPAGPTWPGGEPAALRAQLDETFGDRSEWGPHQVFAAARRASPQDTIATTDSGAHRILMSQMWRCPTPRTLLQSSAFCTMGVALPMAIGVKRAAPNRPVLATMGDAGLEMVLGEMATARDVCAEIGAALPVLVLVDESLALIEMKQRRSQLPNAGVDFPGSNLPALAEALGARGFWIDDADTLEARLREAYETPGVTLLAARITRKAYDGAF